MRGSVLEEICGRWWLKPTIISLPLAAASLIAPLAGLPGVARIGAYALASLAAARMTGSPLIASSLWASAWYGAPYPGELEATVLLGPREAYLGMTIISAAAGLYYGFLRGGPLEPALEPAFWRRIPGPLPLAAASLSAALAWELGPLEYQPEVAPAAAAWIMASAAAASFYPLPLAQRALLGLAAGLGPAGALLVASVGSAMPYCYACGRGVDLEGSLVAVVTRTSRLRAASRLPDGRVVACARGRATVSESHVAARGLKEALDKGAFAVEVGDSLVKGFLSAGGWIAGPGCRGETLLFRRGASDPEDP
jgi:hypothetical protein